MLILTVLCRSAWRIRLSEDSWTAWKHCGMTWGCLMKAHGDRSSRCADQHDQRAHVQQNQNQTSQCSPSPQKNLHLSMQQGVR